MLMNPWHKLEKLCAHTGRTLLRVARFSYYVRAGITLRYPICCTAHFAWDVSNPKLKGKTLTHGPAVKRGSIFVRMRKDGKTKKLYVPCGFHMGRHPGWKSYGTKPLTQLRLFSDEVGR
jgi:hypothetical protein